MLAYEAYGKVPRQVLDQILQFLRRGSRAPHPRGRLALRAVCDACGHIHYQNPKLVVGCLPVTWRPHPHLQARHRAALRICGRCPRDSWRTTSPRPRARRVKRSRKPTRASRSRTSTPCTRSRTSARWYMMFRAKLLDLDVSPGIESLEVKLVTADEIPWSELAFAMVKRTLEHYLEDRERGDLRPPLRRHPPATHNRPSPSRDRARSDPSATFSTSSSATTKTWSPRRGAPRRCR